MFKSIMRTYRRVRTDRELYKIHLKEYLQHLALLRKEFHDMQQAYYSYRDNALGKLHRQLARNEGMSNQLTSDFWMNTAEFDHILSVELATMLTHAAATTPATEIYMALMRYLDRDGYLLSEATQRVLGIDSFDREFAEEDNAGRLETLKGHGKVELMELVRLGRPSYEQCGCYELLNGGEAPDTNSEEYVAYCDKRAKAVVSEMIERFSYAKALTFNGCTTKRLLDALSVLKAIVDAGGNYKAHRGEYASLVEANKRYAADEILGREGRMFTPEEQFAKDIEVSLVSNFAEDIDSLDSFSYHHVCDWLTSALAGAPFSPAKGFRCDSTELLEQTLRVKDYRAVVADVVAEFEPLTEKATKIASRMEAKCKKEDGRDMFVAFMRKEHSVCSLIGLEPFKTTEELFSRMKGISAAMICE